MNRLTAILVIGALMSAIASAEHKLTNSSDLRNGDVDNGDATPSANNEVVDINWEDQTSFNGDWDPVDKRYEDDNGYWVKFEYDPNSGVSGEYTTNAPGQATHGFYNHF